jgi:site-specific recombinase XerD
METSFAVGLNEFEKYMGVKGYSLGTKIAYASHLARFFEWIEGKDIRDVRRVGKDLLRAYLLHLSELRIEDKPLGWGTVCVRVRSVKRFFEYLEATQQILVNPAEAIQEPKRATRLPKFVLSQEQVEKFLGSCDLSTPAGIRSRAILEVFYSTGIRLGEMTVLKVEDVNLEEGLLRVNEGKGAKDRVVPLGKQAAVFLKSYLSDIRPKTGEEERRGPFVGEFVRHTLEQAVDRGDGETGGEIGGPDRVTPYLAAYLCHPHGQERGRHYFGFPTAGPCGFEIDPDLREGGRGGSEEVAWRHAPEGEGQGGKGISRTGDFLEEGGGP